MHGSLILEQSQRLSGAQIQSLNVLAYTNQELNAFLQSEYLENPLLETSADLKGETMQSLEKFYENGSEYRDSYAWEDGDDLERRGDIRAKEQGTLEQMILEQLSYKQYSREEWNLFRYLVCCLDDNGYFPYKAEDIAGASGYDLEMIEKCLGDLKELEPPGIFAEDLSECLILQLKRAGVEDPILYEIADKYMGEILKGHLSTITRKLHISTAEAREYMHILSMQNPRPLTGGSRETQYIVPDILVVREDGIWKAKLNDRWMGDYHLNEYYLRMIGEARDGELKEYFAKKLKRARYVLDCVEQRRETILKIVYAILDYQSDYFLKNAPLKPMTQEDIAGLLHLHATTVSRAVRGKYLQYQRTVLLKDLFCGSVSREETATSEDIKDRIRTLVQKEDKGSPLSDAGLQKRLSEEGISVSRRTVAKYREQMGIPDSRTRGI